MYCVVCSSFLEPSIKKKKNKERGAPPTLCIKQAQNCKLWNEEWWIKYV